MKLASSLHRRKKWHMRITLIEDNASLRKGITYRLNDEGHTVDALTDGLQAEDFLRAEDSDLIILDINLPGQSGLDVLRGMRLRDDPRPVILLTARGETEDRVTGLDAGADDYLVKPFEMDELVARIRALSRRRQVSLRTTVTLGDLTLQMDPPQLFAATGTVDVPRRELTVLATLARSVGTAMSKTQLLDAVYGVGTEADEKVIEVYVSRLRKRLAPHGVRILVQRGIGYYLEVPG